MGKFNPSHPHRSRWKLTVFHTLDAWYQTVNHCTTHQWYGTLNTTISATRHYTTLDQVPQPRCQGCGWWKHLWQTWSWCFWQFHVQNHNSEIYIASTHHSEAIAGCLVCYESGHHIINKNSFWLYTLNEIFFTFFYFTFNVQLWGCHSQLSHYTLSTSSPSVNPIL